MRIYCLYGHGKETERSYWYMQGDYEQDESRSDAINDQAFVSFLSETQLSVSATPQIPPINVTTARPCEPLSTSRLRDSNGSMPLLASKALSRKCDQASSLETATGRYLF